MLFLKHPFISTSLCHKSATILHLSKQLHKRDTTFLVFSPDRYLFRASIIVRMCQYLLVPRKLNLSNKFNDAIQSLFMRYKLGFLLCGWVAAAIWYQRYPVWGSACCIWWRLFVGALGSSFYYLATVFLQISQYSAAWQQT